MLIVLYRARTHTQHYHHTKNTLHPEMRAVSVASFRTCLFWLFVELCWCCWFLIFSFGFVVVVVIVMIFSRNVCLKKLIWRVCVFISISIRTHLLVVFTGYTNTIGMQFLPLEMSDCVFIKHYYVWFDIVCVCMLLFQSVCSHRMCHSTFDSALSWLSDDKWKQYEQMNIWYGLKDVW